MSEQRKAAIKRVVEEAWNKGNLDVIDEFYAPNFALRRFGLGDFDLEGIKDAIRQSRKAFPDYQMTIEDIIVEGDKAAMRYSWRGTHTGESTLMGPPTGKKVEVVGIGITHWVGGKLVDEWNYQDNMGMFQQLGFIP